MRTIESSTPSAMETFGLLKEAWPIVGVEIETAISMFLQTYDPANKTVRFLFGDYVEWVLAAALCHLGIIALPSGPNQPDFDLQSVLGEARSLWSVKASSTKTPSEIRLKNFLGAQGPLDLHPTLFVDPWLEGLVLLDPQAHPEISKHIVVKSDAATLKLKFVKEHAAQHPDCFISAELPIKNNQGKALPGLDEFRAIVGPDQLHFPNLRWILDVSKRNQGASVVDEIRELKSLMERGDLTEEQHRKALELLLET